MAKSTTPFSIAIYVALLRLHDEGEIANIFEQDRPTYDARREAGRRSVFEPENHPVALRSLIDDYEAQAEASAGAGAWLAASLMLGAAAEARLLLQCVKDPEGAARGRAALSGEARPRKSDPFAWTLEQLIHVTAAAGWIVPLEGDDYILFVDRLIQRLREIRNLIHPARYIRETPHLAVEEDIYLDARAAYVVLRLSGEAPAKTTA